MADSRFKFSWTKKFNVSPQAFGDWLYSLPNRSAESIVEAARSPKCVAHRLFEWDNSAAARAYRIRQAQEVVASLEVEVVTPKRKITRVRAFITSADAASYVIFTEATNDELDRAEQKAVAEMIRMRQRWQGIQLARGVISAIDEVRARVSRTRKKKAAA